MRIVSLVPSATEILALIGADRLVGRSHECDHPRSVLSVPALTAQRIDPEAPVHEIDELVRGCVASGESLYTLVAERLASLRPDLIVTQSLCGVCSIDAGVVERVAASLSPEPRVMCLNPQSVEDIFDDVLRLGEATERVSAARTAVAGLRARLFEAQDYVTAFDGYRPVVGLLEWTDPLFVAGHWSVQLIERAGGLHPWNPTKPKPNAGAAAGPQQAECVAGPSFRIDARMLVAGQPEFLVIAPCGLGIERAIGAARDLMAEAWWSELPAVRSGRVVVVDGNAMFNRPGPRVVDALEFLVGWIQGRPALIPTDFPFVRLADVLGR